MHVILDHIVKSRLSCVFNPVVVVHLRVSSCRFLFCLFVCVCGGGGGGGL